VPLLADDRDFSELRNQLAREVVDLRGTGLAACEHPKVDPDLERRGIGRRREGDHMVEVLHEQVLTRIPPG
jgi:hypothetical protein